MKAAFVRLIAGFFFVALSVAAAQAHAHLKSSDPAADSTLTASPTAIHLTFEMRIVAKFSGAKVVDAAGKEMALGTATLDPQDANGLVVPVSAQLSPGEYTVEWHVVAVDSHRMTGSFKFRIKQ